MITSIYKLVDDLPEIGVPVASNGQKWIVITGEDLPRASVVLSEVYPKRAQYVRELFEGGSVEHIRQLCLGEFNGVESDFFDAFMEQSGSNARVEKVKVTAVVEEEEEQFASNEVIDIGEEDYLEEVEEMENSFETVQLQNTVDRLRDTIKKLKEENKALKESKGVVETETIDQDTLEFCYGTLLETSADTLHNSVVSAVDNYIEQGKEEELTKTLLVVFGCMSDTGAI